MLEESSIGGLRWHPNLQEYFRDTSTSCIHGVDIQCGFQEDLKLQSKSGRQDVGLGLEKDRIGSEKNMEAESIKQDGCKNPLGNAVTGPVLVSILKTCAKEKDLHKGRSTHNELIRRGLLDNNVFLGSTLINMYAKCGALDVAQQVFDDLSERNEVTWNALITGYVQHGRGKDALQCFEKMQLGGLSPTAVTYISALKACGIIGALDKGQDIHARLLREHLLEEHEEVANVLVDMYAKCGELDKAKEVLEELPLISLVSWTALISGYVQYGYFRNALHSFEQMQTYGFSPDVVTLSCSLQACGGVGAFGKGQELHAWILREGFLGEDMTIANTLLDMYARCGALNFAQQVFEELPVRDIISWNTLIDGYVCQGYCKEALACLARMRYGGLSPDAATFACVLKACADAKDLDTGQELHACVVIEPFFFSDTALANSVIDMYAKCGALDEAQDVFDELSTRDIVSWNTIIAGYDQHNHCEKAMSYFKQMQLEKFSPDNFTFTCMMRVFGSLGATCESQQLYSEFVKHEPQERVVAVGLALIGMYVNCGMLIEAHYIFDKSPVQDVMLWSVLLEGFTQLGDYEYVFYLFNRMIEEGLKPNSITFLIILNACSHGGLVDKGQTLFELLNTSFDIVPDVEHYACATHIFCRAGLMDNAIAFIKEMTFPIDGTVWRMLLTACQECGNRKLGTSVFERALHGNERDVGAFVCMSNLFSAADRQEHAISICD